jgi:hypothetical protein
MSFFGFKRWRKPMTAFNTKLLLVIFVALQFCGANVWALPTVTQYFYYTDHIGPNSFPGYTFGDKVQLTVYLNSSDPVGSPTISVAAVQSDTTLMLDYFDPTRPDHNYTKFIDFDLGLFGPWEIIPTDSTGTGPSNFTDAIVEPELLPFVENLTVEGTPLGSRVAWTLPDLTGFDVDTMQVSIYEATSGNRVFHRVGLPVQTTSFEPPAVIMQEGVDYVYHILLGDLEGGRAENASRTFSQAFRYTIAGDFNTDGTVDSADYVVWRKTGGTQDGYNLWRAHYGQTAGSGSAGYGHRGSGPDASAQPLSGVPEPSTVVALLAAIQTLAYHRVRQVRQPIG